MMNQENLIEIQNLKIFFPVRASILSKTRYVRAVDDVSMAVPKKSTFAVVGESGSGKTTLARGILRLIQPNAGQVAYQGTNILDLRAREFLPFRRKMQIVFQDPYNSLHPRKLIKTIIGEGMHIHLRSSEREIREKIAAVLTQVGLREEHMYRYPHEFSGGQRQRIAFARAIVLNPELVVLDEPTSALDVSVQAMVLKMLRDIRETTGLTYLFITHNLSIVDYIADEVAVMYLGQIVEIGKKTAVFSHPAHPYTRILMSSNPIPDPNQNREKQIPKGEIPSSITPPSGCRFHTRCPYVQDKCKKEEPPLIEVLQSQKAKCHFPL